MSMKWIITKVFGREKTGGCARRKEFRLKQTNLKDFNSMNSNNINTENVIRCLGIRYVSLRGDDYDKEGR